MEQRRLHSLDAVRGIAALAVVLWHWQHFFDLSPTPIEGWKPKLEPLFAILRPGYLSGWIAVDLFFALSGFVFFWLYAEAIAERHVTPGRFALLRVSRLYPLHWVTLLAVAAMQWTFWRASGGSYFVYHPNDLPHFLAAIPLAQNWVNEFQEFNGPSWSVSVEVLLYIVFFALCRMRLANWVTCLVMALAGVGFFHLHVLDSVARGVVAFFVGGLTFHVAARIRARPDAARIARRVAVFALVVWTVTLVSYYWRMLDHGIGDVMAFIGPEGPLLTFDVILVAPLLIALSLHEWVLGGKYGRLSFLGDISYSTYLLHFPLQLALANTAIRLGWTYEDFMTPAALVAFYAVLIGLGLMSYRWFERPMQAAIRGRAGRHSTPVI